MNSTPRTVPGSREVLWKAMTEKQWTAWVAQTAAGFGWRRAHTWTSIRSPRGWPDEQLCRPPRLVIAELKTMTGKVSPAQQEWLDDLKACPGIECYLWRPCDEDDVIRILAPEGRTIHL